jgi:hypothetical protein
LKLNGWKRLWVFATTLWIVAVLAIGVSLVAETLGDPSHYSIHSKLPDSAKGFYESPPANENYPSYQVPLRFEDFELVTFNFELLEDPTDEDIRARITRYAGENRRSVSDIALQEFIDEVIRENQRAQRAYAEYIRATVDTRRADDQERALLIWAIIATMLTPPIVIFILGFGIAWVRQGFKRQDA